MAVLGAKNMPCLRVFPKGTKALRFNEILIFSQSVSVLIHLKDEGNCIRFKNFCERFFYNTPRYFHAVETGQKQIIDKEKEKKWTEMPKIDRISFFTIERV